jgi:hypothetical protein
LKVRPERELFRPELLRFQQKRADHHESAPEGDRLRHVAREFDAAVGDNRNARAFCRIDAFDNCGNLRDACPVTTRVVQMLPGPIPIFTASTPASISALVPSAVATFPATSSISGYV